MHLFPQTGIALRVNPDLPTDLEELMDLEAARWKESYGRILRSGDPRAAGGLYYQDSRPPFAIADFPTVTLATTQKQLWATGAEATQTAKTDWFLGKKIHVRAFGKITTAATPGNLTVQFGYGTADGTTGALATSAALTLIASQTNITWRFEGYVQCRGTGLTGSLFGSGVFECNPAVIAVGQAMIPASGPAAVGSLDLTVGSGIHLQMARSGSTAETVTVVDMVCDHQN